MSRDHPCCQTTINPATARSAVMARSRANSEGVARLCANRNSGRRYARYTLYFRVIGPFVYFRRQARVNHRNAVCFYSASKVTPSATSCIFRTSSRPLLATFKKLQSLFITLAECIPLYAKFFISRYFLSRAIFLRWSLTRCRPLVYLLFVSTMNRPIRDENEVSPVTRLKLLRFLSYVYARYCQAPTRIPCI